MELSGLIIETSIVHSTKSARPLSIVKFEFQGDNGIFRLNQGLVRRLDYFLDRKPF